MSFCKKFVRLCALTGTFSLISLCTASAQTTGVVKGDNVNVRSAASTGSDVVTKYNDGQTLDITGIENGFYIIDVDGKSLYITTEFAEILKTTGKVNGNGVNIREYPSTDAESIGQATIGCEFTILGTSGDWLKVDYFGQEGYVNKEFIDSEFTDKVKKLEVAVPKETSSENEEAYAVVNADTGLRLRSEPSTESEIIAVIPNGMAVDVVDGNADEWIKVNYNGNTAFLHKEFITIGYGEKPIRSNELGNQIIEYGKQFLGTPYVWAGNSLTSGVDCSGFVYNVFKHFNISLNRSSKDMVRNGYKINKEELTAGDLVFFDTNGGANTGAISHVGIYMGNGNFIHSSSSKRTWGVVISSLNEDYYIRTYVSASRVL